MRSAVLGLFVLGAGMVLVAWGAPQERNSHVSKPDVASAVDSGQGMALCVSTGENRQLITMIDRENKVMSVYQVTLSTGEIELKSVRNLTWDMQMTEYNGISPLPRDIRTMLQRD